MADMMGAAMMRFLPPAEDPAFARKRKLAETLMAQGLNSAPVASPLEAIARPLLALAGNSMWSDAAEADKTQRQGDFSELAKLKAGADGVVDYTPLAANPRLAPLAALAKLEEVGDARKARQALALEDQKARVAEKYKAPTPFESFDEKGRTIKSAMVRDSNSPTGFTIIALGGPKTDMLSPEAQAQKIQIARESRAPHETWTTAQGPDGRPVQRSSFGRIQEMPGQGTIPGSSLETQLLNVVLDPKADTSSPVYHTAYAHLTAPKVQMIDGVPTETRPTLPGNIRQPTGAVPPQTAAPADGSAAPATGATAPASPAGLSMTPLPNAQPKPSKFNNDQNLAAGFADRMSKAEESMGAVLGKGYDPTGLWDRTMVSGYVPLGNMMTSTQGQLFRQAQEDWVRAKLRKESGAAIGEGEMDREISAYFPRAGDSKEVMEQKRRARQTATDAMKFSSGGAYDVMTKDRPKAVDSKSIKQKYGLE